MDKQKIEKTQRDISLELAILILLYENKKGLSIFEIADKIGIIKSFDNIMQKAIKNLVACGIITIKFVEKKEFLYLVSEFGRYFYEKLWQESNYVPWEKLI